MEKFFQVLVVTLIVACLPLTGCAVENCVEGPYCIRSNDIRHYSVEPSEFTPKGIAVDASGQKVDLVAIDRLVDELEECVKEIDKTFDRTKYATDNKLAVRKEWPTEIDRSLLVVKIPNDWVVTEYGNQAILAHDSYNGEVKMAGYAFLDTAYVTPNLAALKHEVIHVAYWVHGHDIPYFECQ
jgi:hypothetical protein